jgi:hypothetical protein
MTIHAEELQRRLYSGEPYNTTAQWYIHLEEPWQMYFRDLEPVEQEFVKDLFQQFRAHLEKILPSESK